MTSYPFLNTAAATAKYYFRFRICWCHCLQKVKVSQQTKFRRDISIDGWDITTSGFEIQTSAILEFYFWFRPRPVRRNLHVILHQATEFRPKTSYPFFKMVSYQLMSLPSEGQSLLANQISSRYLNWRLRYNYFRFRNTNVRHIGILLLISFDLVQFAVICMLFCIRLPNFVQIEAPTAKIWRHIHFLRWRPRRLDTTSGFVSVDVAAFRRSKSISKPNFVEISQLTAEI